MSINARITALIIFLLSLALARVVDALEFGANNFTSEWIVSIENSSFSPTVTTYKDNLIFVSFPSDSTIKLETSKFINKPCVIKTKFNKSNDYDDEDYSFAPVHVETLRNEKIIVVYSESKKSTNQSFLWFFAIEPNACVYDYDKLYFDGPLDVSENFMSIVPYNDSFDVFFKSDKYCDFNDICRLRFSDKPTRMPLEKFKIPFVHKNWDILSVKDYDSNEGYVYVITAAELNATIMKQLDKDFNLKAQTKVNQSGLASYWFTEDLSSSACFNVTNQKLKCIFLDSKMRLKVEKTLTYDLYVQAYATIRLGSEDALIFTSLSDKPNGQNSATYVQYLKINSGTVSDTIKFQEFVCDYSKMSTIRLMDDLYCNYVVCQDMINTKCIGPAENREF